LGGPEKAPEHRMLREGIEKAWERLAEGLGRPEMVRGSPRLSEKPREGPERAREGP